MASCIIYPSSQFRESLQSRSLGRNQSQDNKPIIRDIFQRLNGSRAIIIVLKQEALRFYGPEKLTADRFVSSLRQPTAALIAASDVKTEGYSGEALHDGVIQLYADTEPSVETPTLTLIEAARLRIEQQAVMGRVQLNVGRA